MTIHRTLTLGLCLLALITTGCATIVRSTKRTWDMPHSPAYNKLLNELAQGDGLPAAYSLPVDQARTLALFVIGTNHAVGVTERQHTILAIIPDIRILTPDVTSTNHIAIRLTPTSIGTTLTVLTSMGDLTGPMLSATTFHRLFADAINRSPLTTLPTAPPAETNK